MSENAFDRQLRRRICIECEGWPSIEPNAQKLYHMDWASGGPPQTILSIKFIPGELSSCVLHLQLNPC